ncbi:MAG TPA: YggS family pyridoxal phosphate-dependent enzyme [Nitrospiria bacterium]|nr:YggS family pyridoxal phosphate-dependent enzyme [Nitrospiria bacterium]
MDESIVENLRRVRERIVAAAERSGRDPSRITLVVVTKGVTTDRLRKAVAAGATVLGENRIQEALPKIKVLEETIRWHLIGHLQRNKVKQAIHRFELIHSLDSLELAHEIEERAEQAGIRQRVLIQVNLSREPSKHGVLPEAADVLVRKTAALPHLALEGLMTIPPPSIDPQQSRIYFRRLREKMEELKQAGRPVRELSMGMSNDFEVAIEEGATLVRIGTAIFGPRGSTEEREGGAE